MLFQDSGAEFSESATHRYRLWRQLGGIRGTILWIMLNPSTADAQADDPTVRRILGFSSRWGFTRLVVCNLFALRSTKPQMLFAARAGQHLQSAIGESNDAAILSEATLANRVVAAWGVHGVLASDTTHEPRDQHVLDLLAGVELCCLGVTKHGAPRHPLYVKGDAQLVAYPLKGAPDGE